MRISDWGSDVCSSDLTRGLDVGAAAQVQEFLYAARAAGAGIVLLSEDLEELLQVCDRIAVLYRGRLSPPVPAEEADLATLALLMSGQGAFEDDRDRQRVV